MARAVAEQSRVQPVVLDGKVWVVGAFVGSYPNYFFVVDAIDLPDFFEILDNYDDSEEYITRINKYGVNRAADNFWEVYDWFQKEFDLYHGGEAGIVDLNRYFYLAFDDPVQ